MSAIDFDMTWNGSRIQGDRVNIIMSGKFCPISITARRTELLTTDLRRNKPVEKSTGNLSVAHSTESSMFIRQLEYLVTLARERTSPARRRPATSRSRRFPARYDTSKRSWASTSWSAGRGSSFHRGWRADFRLGASSHRGLGRLAAGGLDLAHAT